MKEKYLILSDVHGNVSAFDAVLSDCAGEVFTGVILLGDLIDYGMRSNEIVKKLMDLEVDGWKDKIIVNIWGNHEKLILDNNMERLSSDRGREVAKYTTRQLSKASVEYIQNSMNKAGIQKFVLCGMRCLAVHGSLDDYYWKPIEPQNLRGDYAGFDIVFGGHSHCSHSFTHFYSVDNPVLRNKKVVVFINPGSVGQPRNQNPYAQYAVISLPSKRVELRAVEYDVKFEQSLYPKEINEFYKIRLTFGV